MHAGMHGNTRVGPRENNPFSHSSGALPPVPPVPRYPRSMSMPVIHSAHRCHVHVAHRCHRDPAGPVIVIPVPVPVWVPVPVPSRPVPMSPPGRRLVAIVDPEVPEVPEVGPVPVIVMEVILVIVGPVPWSPYR